MRTPVNPGIGTTHLCQRISECVLLTGTRSAESIMASGHAAPHQQAGHMAAPTSLASPSKKTLANGEPSTHGTKRTSRLFRRFFARVADEFSLLDRFRVRGRPRHRLWLTSASSTFALCPTRGHRWLSRAADHQTRMRPNGHHDETWPGRRVVFRHSRNKKRPGRVQRGPILGPQREV